MSADALAAYEAIGITPHRCQIDAFDAVMANLRGEAILAQLATGSGKTYLALALCYHIMQKTDEKSGEDAKYWRIILSVPSEELVRQTVANFERTFGKRFRHGQPIVGAWYGKVKHDARIIVACHASLAKTLAPYFQVSRGKPYIDEATGAERYHPIGCAFWLFDECHLAGSDEVTKAVEIIRPKTQLGITATLKPGGIPRFRKVVYDYQIEPAIRDGVLVEPEFVYATAEEQTLDPNITVLSMIRRAAPAGPGVVDAYTVDDAEWFANFLRQNGIPAMAFHSKMTEADRKSVMRDLLSGRLRCLVHVDMLTTGVDVPGLRWLAWRRERGSAMAIVQQGGRLLRKVRDLKDPTLAWAGPKDRAVFLFPRKPDWMRSLALTSPTGASLMGAAEDESRKGSSTSKKSTGPSMTIIPPAEAAPIVGEWISKLVDAVAGYGVAVEAPYKDVDDPDGVWRALPITTKQHVRIMELTKDGHKSPVKYLPKEHREAVKALLRFPEVMLQGHASDLLRLFFGLQKHAGKHYAANKHQLGPAKWWSGVPVIPFPPPVHAIDSLQGGADGA